MRKSSWIVPVLLLIAAIGAPAAHADTTTYEINPTAFICQPEPGFTCPALISLSLDSTITVDNASFALTDSHVGIAGALFTGLPVVNNGGNNPVYWPYTNGAQFGEQLVMGGVEFAAQGGSVLGGIVIADASAAGVSIWSASGTLSLAPVPEPSSLLLLGTGLLGLMAITWRRKRLA